MGKFSRDKGARVERGLVNKLNEAGLEAERVPLSGSMGGSFQKDISLSFLGKRQPFEAKARADGFKEIYKWIVGAKGLFLKANRKETLVVLRLDDFMELMKAAETGNVVKLSNADFMAFMQAIEEPANDNEQARKTG